MMKYQIFLFYFVCLKKRPIYQWAKEMFVCGKVGVWRYFWDHLISSRVLVFCWLARKEKILTIGKLRR